MRIEEAPDFRTALLRTIRERQFSDRTGEVHCSDLNYCLNKALLRRRNPVEESDDTMLLFFLGWATQHELTGSFEDAAAKIVDGIHVTCDAMWPSSESGYSDIVPWECKCSFQSSARPLTDNPHWLRQVMCQCYVMETLEALFSRVEIMGNWKSLFGKGPEKQLPENRRPTLHAWRLTFEQGELDRNWAWFMQRRDLFVERLENGILLPKILALPPGGGYECEFCSFRGKECNGE